MNKPTFLLQQPLKASALYRTKHESRLIKQKKPLKKKEQSVIDQCYSKLIQKWQEVNKRTSSILSSNIKLGSKLESPALIDSECELSDSKHITKSFIIIPSKCPQDYLYGIEKEDMKTSIMNDEESKVSSIGINTEDASRSSRLVKMNTFEMKGFKQKMKRPKLLPLIFKPININLLGPESISNRIANKTRSENATPLKNTEERLFHSPISRKSIKCLENPSYSNRFNSPIYVNVANESSRYKTKRDLTPRPARNKLSQLEDSTLPLLYLPTIGRLR